MCGNAGNAGEIGVKAYSIVLFGDIVLQLEGNLDEIIVEYIVGILGDIDP